MSKRIKSGRKIVQKSKEDLSNHFQRRWNERVTKGVAPIKALNSAIQRGDADVVRLRGRESKLRTHWYFNFGGKEFVAVYNSMHNCVATVLDTEQAMTRELR